MPRSNLHFRQKQKSQPDPMLHAYTAGSRMACLATRVCPNRRWSFAPLGEVAAPADVTLLTNVPATSLWCDLSTSAPNSDLASFVAA